MSQYIPFLIVFLFAALLYVGTIIWTDVLYPESVPSKEDRDAAVRAALLAQLIVARIQPGLFDKVEEEEKTKGPLTPTYGR